MIPGYLQSIFPTSVRARGDGYLRDGRVLISGASPQRIEAVVAGSQDYLVRIEAQPDYLTLSCTCPFAADNGVCKHQWATLRQADAEGMLKRLLDVAGPRPDVDVGAADDDDEFVFESLREPGNRPASPPIRLPVVRRPQSSAMPQWKKQLEWVRQQLQYTAPTPGKKSAVWPANRRLVYIIDGPASAQTNALIVELGLEKQEPDGSWSAPVQFRLGGAAWLAAPDPADRQIAQMLIGATGSPYLMYDDDAPRTSGFVLKASAFDTTLRLMCETGRCRVRSAAGERPTEAVRWDNGPPWKLHLTVHRTTAGGYALTGALRRGHEEMSLTEPSVLHSAGILLAHATLARFDDAEAFAFVLLLREAGSLDVSKDEVPELLARLYDMPRLPPLEAIGDTGVRIDASPPAPWLTITSVGMSWRPNLVALLVGFRYGTVRVDGAEPGATVFDKTTLTIHQRDRSAEATARARLMAAGAREEWDSVRNRVRLVLPRSRVLPMVVDLVRDGWHVDADGVAFRAPGETRATVRSGIDWFELDASVRYGNQDVALPALLDAMANGDSTIALPDGTVGLLPTGWLARLRPLAAVGASSGDVKRFTRSQVGLLDALLATVPEVDADAAFETARNELRTFERVLPADPPRTFRGTLREYQREGLGWLEFLRRFRLGGCLADDMGLGKTVQVLALLEARRIERAGPSIVVVPRSLVFNWMREAERFAPGLRVLDYTGVDRDTGAIDPASVDLVITTYGTLRRDVPALAGIEFEYAILDEAQAIKNATTASAKAARLLRARHRLALSGTPIENRLQELWSIFEFLNPGMLGKSSTFGAIARLMSAAPTLAPPAGLPPAAGHADGRELLARAMRPVILRRTKDQVAPELPERVEQTLEVDLEKAQRKFYDALLEQYRASVLERVDRVGINRARMHILEALLRLRQAACHPVLADPRRRELPSAKLEALLPALVEVVDEGHKAVVFSQFTSFLALVRERLDAAELRYEYLDGRTHDRQSRVDRFQNDPEIPLFLVSLKAGGHGLNLTAADYVYLLDPWWNPAVEAQAIDRAHRIGQTRRVIATRLVARGTIEEKILELQASKRALADAILAADQGGLAKIGREELEALLAG